MSQDRRPPDPATRTEGEGETLDMPEGYQPFTPGQVLGERYQILEMLGRGGMGEVWHAFDLKLRVDVALKALREDFFKSERRLELLRQEVRAAREVVSPNVCRIFDLIEIEGHELVSMEYVDGATLLGVLQEREPLDLKEAQDSGASSSTGATATVRSTSSCAQKFASLLRRVLLSAHSLRLQGILRLALALRASARSG